MGEARPGGHQQDLTPGRTFMMVGTRRNKAQSPSSNGRPLSELASYNEQELDALIAACERDFPEIGNEPAPAHHGAPALPPTPALDLGHELHQTAQAKIDQDATTLKDETDGCYLYGTLAPLFGTQINNLAYRAYLKQLFHEVGNPSDPLERMVIEQLALAHHCIGRLHVKSASSKTMHEATAYIAAAARLMTEYRRSALALKTYRDPARAAHLTVVRQQNVAVGDQQVALVEGGNKKQHPMPRLERSTQQSNEEGQLDYVSNTETSQSSE